MAHICHLTVLNPALHSRIFYKMALAQREAGHQVTVIGQDAGEQEYEVEGIRIIPTGVFSRLSYRRFSSRLWMQELAFGCQADVYHFHSPELFPVVRAIKAARPEVCLIYDMHENYPLNLSLNPSYPVWLRRVFQGWVALQERAFNGYGDAVLFAEAVYPSTCTSFPDLETAIVANKFAKPTTELPPLPPGLARPYAVQTGNLSGEWGIFRALEFWGEFLQPLGLDLVFAGKASDPATLDELQARIGVHPFRDRIHLVGGLNGVPHPEILALIRACRVGLAFYEDVPSVRDKVPTRFYEFMGTGKPLLFSDFPEWVALNAQFSFGVPVNLEFPTLAALPAPATLVPAAAWWWETEKLKLYGVLEALDL